MNFITYANEAAETATRDWNGFFNAVNENLAKINELIARGLGSSIKGDEGVDEGKGFVSIFRTFGEWSSNISSEKA